MLKNEKSRMVSVRAYCARYMVCAAVSLLSLMTFAENPYAASGGKSNSFVSRAYQGVKKFLGKDDSKPPMSSFGQGPVFDIDNGKVYDSIQDSPGHKDFMKAREEDCPELEYKENWEEEDPYSDKNWPYDKLNGPLTLEQVVNEVKKRALLALDDKIWIRKKAISEKRKLTKDECLRDSRLSEIIKINAGHLINVAHLPDIKSLTGDPEWMKLINELAHYEHMIETIESKQQNGNSSRWSLFKKAEAAELPQASEGGMKQENVKMTGNSEALNEFKMDGADTNCVDLTSEPDAQVGVRGWCDCGAEHGKICIMGEGAYSSDGINIGGGDYIYQLCGKCAKLFKPSRSRSEAEIIDLRIERKYKKFLRAGSMPTHKYISLLKQAEIKLLEIPDGEIVIHGACACKEPDPIVFSYAYVKFGKRDFAVCCSCGKEYVSADGSIPCGPTAKREMGLE